MNIPIPATTSARIFLEYDQSNVPPHPGKDWTRFVCLSDTHSKRKFFVPPGDVLLHAGDLSSWGTLDQLSITIEWLKSMTHPTKM